MLSSHSYYAIFHIILIRVHVSGESAHAHCLAIIWRHKLPNEASQKFMSIFIYHGCDVVTALSRVRSEISCFSFFLSVMDTLTLSVSIYSLNINIIYMIS